MPAHRVTARRRIWHWVGITLADSPCTVVIASAIGCLAPRPAALARRKTLWHSTWPGPWPRSGRRITPSRGKAFSLLYYRSGPQAQRSRLTGEWGHWAGVWPVRSALHSAAGLASTFRHRNAGGPRLMGLPPDAGVATWAGPALTRTSGRRRFPPDCLVAQLAGSIAHLCSATGLPSGII